MDPRQAWNTYVYNLQQTMGARGETMTYEDAVRQAVASGVTAPGGVSPQEIGDTLYNLYAQFGPAPTKKYYGDAPTQEDTTSYSGGGTSTGYTAEELQAANAKHKQALADIETAYQNGYLTWEEKNNALIKSRNDLITQKGQGLESNSAYFENVSPDAFQSQQGNYNQKVLDAYTAGENTINNDQKLVDYYKETNLAQKQSGLNAENAFNEATGSYDYGSGWTPVAMPKAPTLSAPAPSPYTQAAKLGVPSWAPNYGGLSTMQAKKKEDEAINKYLG